MTFRNNRIVSRSKYLFIFYPFQDTKSSEILFLSNLDIIYIRSNIVSSAGEMLIILYLRKFLILVYK